MAKTLKNLVPLTIALICIVFMAGYSTSPGAKEQTNDSNKTESLRPDECIFVEAFVVEVKLDALDELGVSPIGEKPNSVSLENILHCLGGKEIAQVSTGLKVSLRSGVIGEAKTTETVYLEHMVKPPKGYGPAASKSFNSHDIARQFSVKASILPHCTILANFEFNQNTYRQTAADNDAPEDTITWQWAGDAFLEPGKPAIVGASQDEDTAVFLILCADVKGK